jgi:bacillithiol biosynthesis deacetylase BshB1
MQSPAERVDLLAIGAHPDDVEFGCSGALILATDAGLCVAVADLTRGERATAGTPEQRARERDRASELMGIARRVGLGLPDAAVGSEASHRPAIAALLRELRPHVVLAPADADRHPDHAATGRLVREACFEATLAEPGGVPGHRVGRLHHYPIHYAFEPSFVVDVSEVWERRMAVVRAYESQVDHPAGRNTTQIGAPEFLELLEARAVFYGAMIGARRGEPFL